MSTHACPYRGCPKQVRFSMLACLPHWRLVSSKTRQLVQAAWSAGPNDSYWEARELAVEEMNRNNPHA